MQEFELRHSRLKIAIRLIAIQIFAIAAIYTLSLIFQNDANQTPTSKVAGVIGSLGLLAIYITMTAMLVRQLRNPAYLTVQNDGRVFWTPFFITKHLRYPPDTTVRFADGEIRFDLPDMAKSATLPTTILIPKTVSIRTNKP